MLVVREIQVVGPSIEVRDCRGKSVGDNNRGVAERVIQEGKDVLGVQRVRQEATDVILSQMR